MRLVICGHCSGGIHGDCLLSYCKCPLPLCEASRQRGDWKKHVLVMGIELPDLNLPPLLKTGNHNHNGNDKHGRNDKISGVA